MNFKHLPNVLTVIRLVLIAPFLVYFYQKNYAYAFYIFVMAGCTDGLDGWLARHFHWQSAFGLFVDPIADKLFIALSFISLALLSQLPWWLVALVFFRDVCIILGVLSWYRVAHLRAQLKPTRLSQCNAVIQGLLVTFCLFDLAFFPVPGTLKSVFIGITTLTSVASYIDYARIWSKKMLTSYRPSTPQ
jgi:cardiolipin synthase